MLVDCHCHMDSFEDPGAIVAQAKVAGVLSIVSNATNFHSIKKNLELAGRFPEIQVCLGLHPNELMGMHGKELSTSLRLIEQNASRIVGVGETGLDFSREIGDEHRHMQELFFRRQILLAQKLGKPIVVHSRDAHQACLDFLKGYSGLSVLMHWFSGTREQALEGVQRGYYLSFGPQSLSGQKGRSLAHAIPLDQIVLETDCPVKFSGRPTTPADICVARDFLAEIKGVTKDDIEAITTANAQKLFHL